MVVVGEGGGDDGDDDDDDDTDRNVAEVKRYSCCCLPVSPTGMRGVTIRL